MLVLLLAALLYTAPPTLEELAQHRRLMLARPAPTLPAKYRKYRAPKIIKWHLPYRSWEPEYRKFFKDLYGDPSLTFQPRAIIMHYTVIESAQGVWDSFARGGTMAVGDTTRSGHISVQLMVDRDGSVYSLLPLNRRGTGCYGADHVALSIEMVAANEADLLTRPSQMFSSFCLVRYLCDLYDIPASHVQSHFEVSLGLLTFPEFTDRADPIWWFAYPPVSFRWDPGERYMALLRRYLLDRP